MRAVRFLARTWQRPRHAPYTRFDDCRYTETLMAFLAIILISRKEESANMSPAIRLRLPHFARMLPAIA